MPLYPPSGGAGGANPIQMNDLVPIDFGVDGISFKSDQANLGAGYLVLGNNNTILSAFTTPADFQVYSNTKIDYSGTFTPMLALSSATSSFDLSGNNFTIHLGLLAPTANRTLDIPDADGTLAAIVATPPTATSTGVAGTIAYDSGFIYVCVATNTWVRAALTTW